MLCKASGWYLWFSWLHCCSTTWLYNSYWRGAPEYYVATSLVRGGAKSRLPSCCHFCKWPYWPYADCCLVCMPHWCRIRTWEILSKVYPVLAIVVVFKVRFWCMRSSVLRLRPPPWSALLCPGQSLVWSTRFWFALLFGRYRLWLHLASGLPREACCGETCRDGKGEMVQTFPPFAWQLAKRKPLQKNPGGWWAKNSTQVETRVRSLMASSVAKAIQNQQVALRGICVARPCFPPRVAQCESFTLLVAGRVSSVAVSSVAAKRAKQLWNKDTQMHMSCELRPVTCSIATTIFACHLALREQCGAKVPMHVH